MAGENSLFYDDSATIDFRYVNPNDPDGLNPKVSPRSWPADTWWTFKRYQTDDDMQAQATSLAETELKYDPDEERKWRRSGREGDYQGHQIQRMKKTARRSMIEGASITWRGSGFVLPAAARLPKSNRPHPLAGRPVPCEPEYIGALHPLILQEVADFLNFIYKNPELPDEDVFRELGIDPPGREESGVESQRDTVAAGVN